VERLSTKQLILEAAVRRLNEAGAEAFRIEDICLEVHVAKSSIYHFFGSRSGLIAAAEIHRYKASVLAEKLDPVKAAEACTTPSEFQALVLAEIERSVVDPGNKPVRRLRLGAVARSLETGDGIDDIAQIQEAFIGAIAAIFERAQAKGLVDPALDCRAYAAFMHALTLGRTLTSLGFPDDDRWLEVVNVAAVAPLIPAKHR
jgi:AcrR family transcriptional regulator